MSYVFQFGLSFLAGAWIGVTYPPSVAAVIMCLAVGWGIAYLFDNARASGLIK